MHRAWVCMQELSAVVANDQLREAHRDIAFLQAAHLLSQSHGHRPRWSAGCGTGVPFATALFSDGRKQLGANESKACVSG